MASGQGALSAVEDPAVVWENVTKVYGEGEDSLVALEDIDCRIPDERFVSIIGPSGCGKSTLLHITAAILEQTEGTVQVNGNDVSSPNFQQHEVGIVFQKPVLLPWRTVRRNVLLPVEVMVKNDDVEGTVDDYADRADELLEMVGLEGFEDAYPNELSGGMKQRVSICRSLVYDPSLIAMDEPFGALDAFTRDKLNNELLDIWQETNKTILFVTHNIEEAVFLSDYVVVLSSRPGRIIDVLEVDIDRPRDQDTRQDPQYNELVGRAYSHFEEV